MHHSSRDLDWLAGSRVHLVETVLTRSIVVLPLLAFGFEQPVVNAYAILVGLQAVIAHANINLPLVYMLMGTFKLPNDHSWPDEYGVFTLESVPRGFAAQHAMPFRWKATYDDYVR